MDASTLRQFASDPARFRAVLVVERADGRRARLGDCLAPFQEACFSALDPAWVRLSDPDAPAPKFKRLWTERHRGASKSQDAAVMALWVLAFSRRQVRGVVVAVDGDQAGIVQQAVDRLVRLNPWLAQVLTVSKWKVTNERTGSTLEIIASDVASSWGLLIDFAIFDEAASHPDDGMWTSIASAIGKKPDAVLVTLGNCGWRDSWVWELREKIRLDPAWYFHEMHDLAPWVSQAQVDEQRKLLPAVAFDRLWGQNWVDSAGGDAFRPEDVDAVCTLAGPQEPEPGYNYICVLDLAVRKDCSAAVVLARHCGHRERIVRGESRVLSTLDEIRLDLGHLDQPTPDIQTRLVEGTGKLKVALVKVWRPTANQKVSLEGVKQWVLDQHERYKFRCVAADPAQAEMLLEQLREAGLNAEPRDQTGGRLQEQATCLVDVVTEKRIELYPHPDLIADLKRARVVEKSYGWRLSWPRFTGDGDGTRHGDAGTALSIGVAVSKRYKRRPGPPRVDRPLVCA